MELTEWNLSLPSTLSSGSPGGKLGSDAPRLVIRLLGNFAIESAGIAHDEAAWHRVHARRLVQMIGSTPRLQESREAVLRTLWPDFDEPRARNRLHHTVHLIRKSLEALPLSVRPQWDVNSARVALSLPPLTVVDAQQFRLALDADAPDDASRLAHIEQALGWYRGELAGDWADTGDVATRRAWLARQHEAALEEAVTLSVELERFDRALRYAERRAQLLLTDVEAQCTYAELLMRQGRADAALAHCQSARRAFESDGDLAPARLDAVARDIQQRVNQTSARGAAVPPRARPVDAFGVDALPPRKPLLGFERALAAAQQCLLDPHGRVISLVGPPGAGKTALAVELSHSCHSRFTHGVLWVDCRGIEPTLEALVARLAACVGVPGDPPAEALAAVLCALRSRELLVVLDGLEFGASMAPAFTQLLGAGHDVRWLTTAWSSVNVPFEKAVLLDSSELLWSADGERPTSAAARLVACMGSHAWRLEEKRIRKAVEAIALSVDALPVLLESAARALESIWPNELLAKIDRDPATLLRPIGAGPAHGAVDLVRWLRSASLQAVRLLTFAGHCSSWLTRLDLALLLDADEPCDIGALIDHCVNHHYLQRRVRHDRHESWSEFRVPRYCKAALLLCDDAPAAPLVHAHFERWLAGAPRNPAQLVALGHHGRSDTEWFDDRIDDFDALIRRWHAQGRRAEIAALCAAQPACWSSATHAGRTLEWLHLLGERMEGLDDELASGLLVKRARLRARLGQIHAAFDDASRALGRAKGSADTAARSEAVRLIERYGKAHQDVGTGSPLAGDRGVDAGESLLRIAQLAAKHGDPRRAMLLCTEAVAVFTYFGLVRGVLRAHRYRVRIAYGMGDTALALQCITQCETTARSLGEDHGIACAELMRANVLLADSSFGRAIELATKVLARPQIEASPALLSRGLLALGWGYYATGALPVLRAMIHGLIEQTGTAQEPGAQASAELLAMLVLARQGQVQAALRHARPLVELLARRPPLPDTQGDLVNAIDLAVHLGRPALAQSVVHALQSFGDSADHRLRPWTRERFEALKSGLRDHAPDDQPAQVPEARYDTRLRWVLETVTAD